MPSFKAILSLLSLVHGMQGADIMHVPTATAPAPALLPRQLLSGGCGLSFNIWGQMSPVSSSGYANLCLQCRVNVLGIAISFSFYDALSTSISAHGVSASDAAILQTSIGNELSRTALLSKTSLSCTSACSADERCASSTFVSGACRLNAVDYVSQNKAGGPLATAFHRLFQSGGSNYCSICPSDSTCYAASPSGLPRRTTVTEAPNRCPPDTTACPLTPTTSFTSSTPFECLNTSEELTSCGGCATLGRGTDCSNLDGVATSGCSNGSCKIFSCKSGYRYSKMYNSCYKSQRMSKLKL